MSDARILYFIPGARSRDTLLRLFGQISKMSSTEAGDDSQSLTGLIFFPLKMLFKALAFIIALFVAERKRVVCTNLLPLASQHDRLRP